MKTFLLCTILLLGCGTELPRSVDCTEKGQDCKPKTTQTDTPPETKTVYIPIPGPAGKDGKDGKDGLNALQPFISVVPADATMCPNGGHIMMWGYDANADKVFDYSEVVSTIYVCNGLDGVNGTNGTNGSNGSDGTDCSVSPAVNGAVIDCTDGSSAVVLNGTNGTNGIDGAKGDKGDKGNKGDTGATGASGQNATPSAFSVVEVINPCGQGAGYNEVLLRLANGSIIAHYADGNKQFLSLIGPGSYVTTDFSPCYFTIHPDNSISW